MPFDGSTYTTTLTRTTLDPVRALDPVSVILTAWIVGFVIVGLVLGTDIVWPESGLYTRLVYGNQVANENQVARAAMHDSHWLQFYVAGRKYQLFTPRHEMIPEQRTALIRYAARHHYPVWSVDGPLAIDP